MALLYHDLSQIQQRAGFAEKWASPWETDSLIDSVLIDTNENFPTHIPKSSWRVCHVFYQPIKGKRHNSKGLSLEALFEADTLKERRPSQPSPLKMYVLSIFLQALCRQLWTSVWIQKNESKEAYKSQKMNPKKRMNPKEWIQRSVCIQKNESKEAYASKSYCFLSVTESTYGRQREDLIQLQFLVAHWPTLKPSKSSDTGCLRSHNWSLKTSGKTCVDDIFCLNQRTHWSRFCQDPCTPRSLVRQGWTPAVAMIIGLLYSDLPLKLYFKATVRGFTTFESWK